MIKWSNFHIFIFIHTMWSTFTSLTSSVLPLTTLLTPLSILHKLYLWTPPFTLDFLQWHPFNNFLGKMELWCLEMYNLIEGGNIVLGPETQLCRRQVSIFQCQGETGGKEKYVYLKNQIKSQYLWKFQEYYGQILRAKYLIFITYLLHNTKPNIFALLIYFSLMILNGICRYSPPNYHVIQYKCPPVRYTIILPTTKKEKVFSIKLWCTINFKKDPDFRNV